MGCCGVSPQAGGDAGRSTKEHRRGPPTSRPLGELLPRMKVRFYIDPETDLPHIYRHGVSESEVEDVLSRPGEDRPGSEGSRVALGQTTSGRYLRVIYVPDTEPRSVFVATAYELRGKALLAYRRRRRRRR